MLCWGRRLALEHSLEMSALPWSLARSWWWRLWGGAIWFSSPWNFLVFWHHLSTKESVAKVAGWPVHKMSGLQNTASKQFANLQDWCTKRVWQLLRILWTEPWRGRPAESPFTGRNAPGSAFTHLWILQNRINDMSTEYHSSAVLDSVRESEMDEICHNANLHGH